MINQAEKIAILGAGGNLGTALARVMGNNYRLLLWDKNDFDVLDFIELENRLRVHKPAIIINCVAYNAVDKCEEDAKEFALAEKLNYELVQKLADISSDIGSVLVQFASDYVFNGKRPEGYLESDKTGALNKYGETKIMTEKAVTDKAGAGLKHYLIRTSKLFGPAGESGLSKPGFFDLILRLSRTQKELKMIDKEEISCFTYTLDLAGSIKYLIENKKAYGIYHIVNEGPASWYEGARYMFDLLDINGLELIPVTAADYPRPARRPRYSVLLNTKLPKLRSWKEALKEYLNSHNA